MKKWYLSGAALLIAGAAIYFTNADLGAEEYQARIHRSIESEPGGEEGEEREIKGALEQMYALRLNQETHTIDPEDVRAAYSAADQMASAKKALTMQWTERGPDNVGGRTRALLIDRNNHLVIYAGGVGGGLWKSKNGSKSWAKVNDMAENLAVSCITQTVDGTVYYGTGEQAFTQVSNGTGNSGVIGGGMWKSTDGVSFTRISSTANGGNWNNTNSLACDPQVNRIYAGNDGGLFWSENAGQTWTKAQPTNIAGSCREVKVGSDGVVFAYIGNRLYRSTDGKTGYTVVGSGTIGTAISRMSIAIAPSDPNYIYAMTSSISTQGLEGVYQSKDQGTTWTKILKGGSIYFDPLSQVMTNQGQGFYDNVIAVDPFDREHVIMGGVQLAEWSPSKGGLLIGSLFQSMANPLYVHADKHAFVFDTLQKPALLFIGSDGGIGLSLDGWKTFTQANRNYNVTQFYGVSANAAGHVLAGAQDNGNQYIDKMGNTPLAGMEVKGGDGFQTEISRIDPNILFAEYVNGAVQRSSNRGGTFSDFFDDRVKGFTAPFSAPFLLWENTVQDTSSLFALGCNNEVWITNKSHVVTITPYWFKAGTFAGISQSLAFTPNGNHMFVGTFASGLYRISNLQAFNYDTVGITSEAVPPMFTTTKLTGIPNGRAVTGVYVDPNDSNRLVVTLGNYGNLEYVYITNNALDASPTFTAITNNLPKMPVYDAIISSRNSNHIVLATELGMWGSDNGGATWTEQNTGMARVATYRIRQYNFNSWQGPTLYVATHGRGVFQSNSFYTSTGKPMADIKAQPLKLYPNPASSFSMAEFDLPKAGSVQVVVIDLQGREVYNQHHNQLNAGTNSVRINTDALKAGNYVIRITGEEFKAYQKMVVVN